MNPVLAGLVSDGSEYPCSSASYRILSKNDPTIMVDYLNTSSFRYPDFSYEEEHTQDFDTILRVAQQGKAWGKASFLARVAKSLGKLVVPRARGRPKKINNK